MPLQHDAILLIEDEPKDVELTLRAFRRQGLEERVVVAQSGQEALAYLFCKEESRDPCTPPALVLLDLKLPGLDGREVLRRMRAHPLTRLVPVVVLTSSDEESDRVACYATGANSYVRKPIDFNRFVEVVRQLGVYWLFVNEPPPPPRRDLGGSLPHEGGP